MTLSYPRQADHANGRIFILSPAGSALLGLSEQQQIDWNAGSGNTIRITVLEVTWQLEANGRFDLWSRLGPGAALRQVAVLRAPRANSFASSFS
ncbi:MAG: GreA/GreB family elongation factor [Rhodocyclaceae bacterium]